MTKTPKPVPTADLFCGAGGTTSGMMDAADELGLTLDLVAINHWDVAIATHSQNHPNARHLCTGIENVNPREVVPGGYLKLLVASPECTHFSTARGGKPMNDQKRADPWQIVRWAEALKIDNILIENVPEFRTWGPLNDRGRPLKKRKGEKYRVFLSALRAQGYNVEDRILNAADYGDPTTRRRLFIIARRGKITWPEPTHASTKDLGTRAGLKPWRAAREIIDWSIQGESIFSRKRPLSPKTMDRIAAGLQRFGGPEIGPFLVVLKGGSDAHIKAAAHPVSSPVPTVCASGNHIGLAEPFLLGQQSGSVARSVSEPVPTISTDGAVALVEPFIVPRYGERPGQTPRTHSIDEPMPTIPTTCQHMLVEPFIMSAGGPEVGARPVSEPMNTVLTRDHMALVEPFLIETNHGESGKAPRAARAVSEPMPTVTGKRGRALVQALISKYYGTSVAAKPVTEPLDTVTTKDRFGLVTFEKERGGLTLDIRFRMLKPHELAGAQSLQDMTFTGNTEQQVKQIGNAVPRSLAKALCRELLKGGA